ncbi:cytochrome b5-like heme/steroid binding domain-containing protein [Macrophomina phaseolina]|uniref:Cytochrome b5-like heme/steroid binding domain-containing protein n=1 Tax=Macrophomina phaseolina TaxID=35725 RepID=A0ABQ8FVB1_9PEZI|nr:cytochrome b5-like heme/steroid binding domain-containing protein [Macrophomina phaseolina]
MQLRARLGVDFQFSKYTRIDVMAEITELSLAEVAKHSQGKDLWVCIRGNVYDVSDFVEEHPGGEEVLRAFAGKDATEAFEDAAHSEEVKPIIDGLIVGRVPSLQQPNVTHSTERPAQIISTEKPEPKIRQSHAVRKGSGSGAKMALGLVVAILLVLKLIVAAPGYAFFVVAGTISPVSLLVYCFIAVTSRHRGAEDYADYIKPNTAT